MANTAFAILDGFFNSTVLLQKCNGLLWSDSVKLHILKHFFFLSLSQSQRISPHNFLDIFQKWFATVFLRLRERNWPIISQLVCAWGRIRIYNLSVSSPVALNKLAVTNILDFINWLQLKKVIFHKEQILSDSKYLLPIIHGHHFWIILYCP